MKKKYLELSEVELNELTAKVANQIAEDGDMFSKEIYDVFIKLLKLEPTVKSELVVAMELTFMGIDLKTGERFQKSN